MSKTLTFDPTLEQRLTAYIQQQGLITRNQTVIVGFSGGPDSVFLLHWLSKLQSNLQLSLVAAHLDHGWRKNSAADAQWCAEAAQNLGVTFISKKASEISLPERMHNGSKEEQGRALRRSFLKEIAQAHPNSIIALGHHADDQQETFFIRLLRGAGVTGLAGIKPREIVRPDGIIIHPLLCCSKQEIVTMLEKNGIEYLIDPTNVSDQFLRNRIRMQVIPALRECDARCDESIKRTMENLRATDDFLQQHTQELFETCTSQRGSKIWLDTQLFFKQHPFMQKRVLLHWLIAANVPFTPSQALFDEITRFLQNTKSSEHTFYNAWKIVKKGELATLALLE